MAVRRTHAVDPDGQNDRNLTPNTEDSMELDPELSPDGTRIVFISNRVIDTNPDGNFEIYTMALQTERASRTPATAQSPAIIQTRIARSS